MNLETIAFAWTAVFSLALFVIGMQSYRRAENPKLALVACGFLVFFVKGAILAASLFEPFLTDSQLWLAVAVLDTVALLLLFGGVYKR